MIINIELLSRAVISDKFTNSSENMRNRVPPLQNSKKGHQNGGTRFLTRFSEEFANLSLITARDNIVLAGTGKF